MSLPRIEGRSSGSRRCKEITWINASGREMRQDQWADDLMLCFGMILDGRAQATGIRQRGQDATMLIIFNAYRGMVRFTLPGADEKRIG